MPMALVAQQPNRIQWISCQHPNPRDARRGWQKGERVHLVRGERVHENGDER
jgi:hypothetical protein